MSYFIHVRLSSTCMTCCFIHALYMYLIFYTCTFVFYMYDLLFHTCIIHVLLQNTCIKALGQKQFTIAVLNNTCIQTCINILVRDTTCHTCNIHVQYMYCIHVPAEHYMYSSCIKMKYMYSTCIVHV